MKKRDQRMAMECRALNVTQIRVGAIPIPNTARAGVMVKAKREMEATQCTCRQTRPRTRLRMRDRPVCQLFR